MAWEETGLMLLLWAGAAAIAYRYGSDEPEAMIWSAMLMVLSLPHFATFLFSMINVIPASLAQMRLLPARRAKPAASSVPRLGDQLAGRTHDDSRRRVLFEGAPPPFRAGRSERRLFFPSPPELAIDDRDQRQDREADSATTTSAVMAPSSEKSCILSNRLPSPAPTEVKTKLPGMMPIKVAST